MWEETCMISEKKVTAVRSLELATTGGRPLLLASPLASEAKAQDMLGQLKEAQLRTACQHVSFDRC